MIITCTSYDGEKYYAIDKGYVKFHFQMYNFPKVILLGIELLPENKHKIIRFPNKVKIGNKIYYIKNGLECFLNNDFNILFYMPWLIEHINYILFNNILLKKEKELWKIKWRIL